VRGYVNRHKTDEADEMNQQLDSTDDVMHIEKSDDTIYKTVCGTALSKRLCVLDILQLACNQCC